MKCSASSCASEVSCRGVVLAGGRSRLRCVKLSVTLLTWPHDLQAAARCRRELHARWPAHWHLHAVSVCMAHMQHDMPGATQRACKEAAAAALSPIMHMKQALHPADTATGHQAAHSMHSCSSARWPGPH